MKRLQRYETFEPRNLDRQEKLLTGYLVVTYIVNGPHEFWVKKATTSEEAIETVRKKVLSDPKYAGFEGDSYIAFKPTDLYFVLQYHNNPFNENGCEYDIQFCSSEKACDDIETKKEKGKIWKRFDRYMLEVATL
jgi:hypothetical protein